MPDKLEKNTKVAITARTDAEGAMLHQAAEAFGFKEMQVFRDPRATVEVAQRKQFQLFITHHDFADMSGLTMIQTLRSTGNYGVEPHLFLLENLTPEIMLVLVDHNIHHILTAPFLQERVEQKLRHLWSEETNMKPAESQYREAHAAMNAGLLDMAQDVSLKTLRTHGPTEKLLILMGDIQIKREQAADARRYYDAAHHFNPNSSAAVQKLAQTYVLEKNYERASQLLNELTRLNPLNLDLLANAGLANYEISQFEEAKDAMTRLQRLDKERQDASAILAKVAMKAGDYETALRELQTTHSAKEIVQLLNNEGVKRSQNHDVAGAVTLYLQCIRIIGHHASMYALYYNLGLAYLKLQELDSAETWLKKSLEVKPGFDKATQVLHKLQSSRG